MNDVCPYSLEQLLPHRFPAILIDNVHSWDEVYLTSSVQVRADTPFLKNGEGVPCHIAIEWMAQTCGAYAGMQDVLKGREIKLGLLLGTRNFKANAPMFLLGEKFIVRSELSYRDETIGVFDCNVCEIESGQEYASAQLSVYQPVDPEEFLASQKI